MVGVLYLTGAALYLNLSDWPPTVLDGLIVYGAALVLLAVEFFVRRRYFGKETPRGSAVAA